LSFAAAAATLGVAKLVGKRFDVILTFQYSPATVGLPAVVLRALRQVPHVVWVQDLWPESLAASGVSSRLLLGVTGRFVRWTYGRSDHLIGQSRAFLSQLRTRSPVSTPISYLPNWPAAPTRATRENCLGKSSFDIYFLGNLGQAQDLPAVMSAAHLLAEKRGIHWHFVGDGSMADWLRRQIGALKLDANVHLHDAVPPDRLQPFVVNADALLVSLRPDPLYAMTVPSKVQSYLSSGRPILGMLDGEGAEVLAESGAGLVARAGDPAGLARIVQRLVEMAPADREAMGQAGIRYCAQHFDFDTLIGRLELVLNEVQLSH
jgi:glycosyltransferase involved in cell wall biosynthesis